MATLFDSSIILPDRLGALSTPSTLSTLAGLGTMTSLLLIGLTSCSTPEPAPKSEPAAKPVEKLRAHVVERLPFNRGFFTQGLEVDPQGNLLVGTGLYNQSRLLRIPPTDVSHVLQQADLPAYAFGEGITQAGSTIWQLTWRDGYAVSYDATTLTPTGKAYYTGEGWGLCALDAGNTPGGGQLVMSNGSAELTLRDPHTFAETSRVTVTLNGTPVDKLNELECADGQVYANKWFSTDIYRIDPHSGVVTGIIDASPATGVLNNGGPDPDNVLNGIAHLPGSNQFFITGKRWPDLYHVTFEPVG